MGHLVLAGAGHAHMTALVSIPAFMERGHTVTVVGPDPHHYYSGMGPGMLGRAYTPEQIRFDVERMAQARGATYLRDKLASVDANARTVRLESGQELVYDAMSLNIGSYVPLGPDGAPAPSGDGLYTVKPIESLLRGREHMERLAREREYHVVVAGGGPAALEVAGNAWAAAKAAEKYGHNARITILAGTRLMGRFLEPVPSMARRVLEKRGIEIRESVRATELAPGRVVLDNGEILSPDVIFVATGVKPSQVFAASNLPLGPDGGLAVNRYLQCDAHPELFGGGDCIHFTDHPLDKVGVYAVRQNMVLVDNLMAYLDKGKDAQLTPFDPGGDYLLVFNVGGGKGILRKGPIVFGGCPAFWIKDWIDRRFMRHFHNAK